MDWHERPSDAPDSWAADELCQRLARIPVRLRLVGGDEVAGTLEGASLGAVFLETDRSRDFKSADVTAYAIGEEPIDRSDELR